jgi:BioD-like phosphotransacetylase family protein
VLGKAADAGKPVLAVNTDTVTAIDRAEGIVRSGRTRDARTVDRMAELLNANVDIGALV